MSRRYERSDSVNCMMCCKPSLANCVLDPCGHSPACDDCSAKMILCITCDAIIGRRLKVIPVSEHVPDPRVQSSSEAKECLVCNKISEVGNCLLKPCGHSPACERCSATLTDCLTCDKHIEREPKTNILERNFSNSGSAVRNAGISLSMSSDYHKTPEVKSEDANRCCLVCFGEENVSLFDNGPEWAAKLYFCITCKQNIASRIKIDGSLAATPLKEQCPTASGGAILKQQPAKDKSGIFGVKSGLQDRYLNSLKKNTVQSSSLCKVCNVKLRSMNFQCGHSACSECASKMTVCIVCKTTITNRVKINSSDALIFKVQPLNTRYAECLVCLKMSEANTILEPCGHALACEACSASISQCLICNCTVGTGGSKSFIPSAESYPDDRTTQASTIGYYAERGQSVMTGVLDECQRISAVISDEHSTKGHFEKKTPVTNTWKSSEQQEPYTAIRRTHPTYSSIAAVKGGATSTNSHLKEVSAFAVANQRNPSLTTTTYECLLCHKNSKHNHALPCGHNPTCKGCSASLKQCLVCDATIVPQKAIDVLHRGSGVVKNNDCLVSREADESRSRGVFGPSATSNFVQPTAVATFDYFHGNGDYSTRGAQQGRPKLSHDDHSQRRDAGPDEH